MIDQIPPPPPACIAAITTLRYPWLAAVAQIQGSVTVRIGRNSEGRLEVIDSAGHPLLKGDVERTITESTFPHECPGRFEFEFVFVLQGDPAPEAEAKVTIESPSRMRVERPPTGLICVLNAEVRRPWYKRLFARK